MTKEGEAGTKGVGGGVGQGVTGSVGKEGTALCSVAKAQVGAWATKRRGRWVG